MDTTPTPAPTSASAPPPPYRSARTRAIVAAGLLTACVVIALAEIAMSAVGLDLMRRADAGLVTVAEARHFVEAANVLSVLDGITFIATVVAFLAWLSRAVDNVPSLNAGSPPSSPRWAIAWWFVPFANYGMPYDIVRDLWHRMRRRPSGGHPILLLAWWFAWILGITVSAAITALPTTTTAEVRAAYGVAIPGALLIAAAGVLAILVIRGIERAASERAAEMSQIPAGTAGAVIADPGPPTIQRNWRMRPSWVGFVAIPASAILYLAILLTGGGPAAHEGVGSDPTAVAPSSTAVGGAHPGPAPSAQPSTEPVPGLVLHQAAALEHALPSSVAGQRLVRWSVRGRDFYELMGMTDDQVAEVIAELEREGISLDDVMYARATPPDGSDTPYVISAIRIRGIARDLLVPSDMVEHPEAGAFTPMSVDGKKVWCGVEAMVTQGASQRGLPYVYIANDVMYLVVADDPFWAFDALKQLP